MPTYVYHCSNCDQDFETDQRIVEPPLDTCILCHTTGTVKRVIQPIAVMFKGSGFHINDYAKAGSGGPAKSEAAPASDSKSETASETKSESSTAAKTEPTSTAAPAPATSTPPTSNP